MLRLDSSEMLPGSQEGEEKTAILKPHTPGRHFGHASASNALDYGISMVGTRDTARCKNSRASLIDM